MSLNAAIERPIELQTMAELLEKCEECVDTQSSKPIITDRKKLEGLVSYIASQRCNDAISEDDQAKIRTYFELLSSTLSTLTTEHIVTTRINHMTTEERRKHRVDTKNPKKEGRIQGTEQEKIRAQRVEDRYLAEKSPYTMDDFLLCVEEFYIKFDLKKEFMDKVELGPILEILLSENDPQTIAEALIDLRKKLRKFDLPTGLAHGILTTAKFHNAVVLKWIERLTKILPSPDAAEVQRTRWKIKELDDKGNQPSSDTSSD